jgi:hypothetical protein
MAEAAATRPVFLRNSRREVAVFPLWLIAYLLIFN